MLTPNGTRRVPHLRLIELRIQEGLTPNGLAYRAGLSGKTVRLAEDGWIPSPPTQFAIAGVFGLTPLDLWPLDRSGQKVAAPARRAAA
jgi:DNA-binding XRE family transcriptional regulator